MKYQILSRIRLKTYKAHSRRISALASSQDGLTVVSVSWDGECKIWSGRGHREISSLRPNDCPYNCLAYHPERDYVITGDWNGLLKIFDLTSLERKAILRGCHEGASIQDLKMASDASLIISADIHGIICIFDGKLFDVHQGMSI